MNTTETPGKNRTLPHGVAEWAAVGAMAIVCALLIVALILPPPGHIDNSVLVAFGEICTFAGTVFGVGNTLRRRPQKQ